MFKLTDCIKGTAKFVSYRAGNLYYRTENGFVFPVPISDIGEATFNNEEKGLMLMRYIRRHLDTLSKGNELSQTE